MDYLGWICPKCDRVWAPHIKECNHCNTLIIEKMKSFSDKVSSILDDECGCYSSGWCTGVKEPFLASCKGNINKCTEYKK